MRTVVSYLNNGFLNSASSSVASGSSDATTGIAFPTGLNSGDFLEINDAQALAYSKTSVGTLYSGIYQRVKFTAATSLALGQAVFWNPSDTSDPYAVTNVYAAGVKNNFAGVVIDTSTTAGQYAWIQVNGKATCLFDSATAGDTIGDSVFLTAAANTFSDPTQSGAPTDATFATFIGVALAAPAASTASLVDIKRAQTRF